MATMRIISIAGESKNAMLRFLVLNPHVLHADMACATASNHRIPASLRANVVMAVSPT